MEVIREVARVPIHDSVYESIQQSRYCKHVQALSQLKMNHSRSEYQLNRNDIAGQLDKYKRKKREVEVMLFPRDVEYRNCMRRINEISGSEVRLPKIRNLRRGCHREQKEQESRIDKQNKILLQKFDHLQHQKQHRRKELSKSIQKYESYRSLSRRIKPNSLEKGPSPR